MTVHFWLHLLWKLKITIQTFKEVMSKWKTYFYQVTVYDAFINAFNYVYFSNSIVCMVLCLLRDTNSDSFIQKYNDITCAKQ